MAKARAALSQSVFRRLVLVICLVLPFGNKILRLLSGWLLGGLNDIGKIAKEIIKLRREESSSRRMVLIELISNECVLSDGMGEREIERYNIRKKE